jgi:hypothetical protein
MSVATEPIGLNFLATGQVINGSSHVENMLPSEALPGHDVSQEQEAFQVAASMFISLFALSESQRVGAQHDIAFPSECDAGVVHGITGKACRFALAKLPLAVVLVPDADPRSRPIGVDFIGNEQVRGDTFAGFRLILHAFAAESVAGLGRNRLGA